MAQQFVVPQFLDVEAKIIGPITGRQFVIMLVTLGSEFIIYSIFLNIAVVIILGLPVLVMGIILAFAKVNGQPFHFIVLAPPSPPSGREEDAAPIGSVTSPLQLEGGGRVENLQSAPLPLSFTIPYDNQLICLPPPIRGGRP